MWPGYQSRSSSIKTVDWSAPAPSATSGGGGGGTRSGSPCSGRAPSPPGVAPLLDQGPRAPAVPWQPRASLQVRAANELQSQLGSWASSSQGWLGSTEGARRGPPSWVSTRRGVQRMGQGREGKKGGRRRRRKKNTQGAERLPKIALFRPY